MYAYLGPDPVMQDWHHVVPTSWGGPNAATNRIRVSPSTHRRIHVGLDACVAMGSPENVPVEVRRHLGKCWPLVVQGWNGADPAKRHRTL